MTQNWLVWYSCIFNLRHWQLIWTHSIQNEVFLWSSHKLIGLNMSLELCISMNILNITWTLFTMCPSWTGIPSKDYIILTYSSTLRSISAPGSSTLPFVNSSSISFGHDHTRSCMLGIFFMSCFRMRLCCVYVLDALYPLIDFVDATHSSCPARRLFDMISQLQLYHRSIALFRGDR